MRTCDILKVLMYPLGIISVISTCSIKVADIKIMENFLFSNFTNHVWKTVKYNKFPPIKGFQVLSNTDQQTVFGWRGVKPIVANSKFICLSFGTVVPLICILQTKTNVGKSHDVYSSSEKSVFFELK